MNSADENATTKSVACHGGDVIRRSDRWLVGLMIFLVALVMVSGLIGWTAISRQNRATCYQLTSIEAARFAETELARTDGAVNRVTHIGRAESLRVYAAGLRAIVPGCPHPQRR